MEDNDIEEYANGEELVQFFLPTLKAQHIRRWEAFCDHFARAN